MFADRNKRLRPAVASLSTRYGSHCSVNGAMYDGWSSTLTLRVFFLQCDDFIQYLYRFFRACLGAGNMLYTNDFGGCIARSILSATWSSPKRFTIAGRSGWPIDMSIYQCGWPTTIASAQRHFYLVCCNFGWPGIDSSTGVHCRVSEPAFGCQRTMRIHSFALGLRAGSDSCFPDLNDYGSSPMGSQGGRAAVLRG